MRRSAPTRRKSYGRHEPYGGKQTRSEHRALRVGHILRPEYSRKLVRMITRVFR
jgi:hypothetical protein